MLVSDGAYLPPGSVADSGIGGGHQDKHNENREKNQERWKSQGDMSTQSFDIRLVMLAVATGMFTGALICLILALCELC